MIEAGKKASKTYLRKPGHSIYGIGGTSITEVDGHFFRQGGWPLPEDPDKCDELGIELPPVIRAKLNARRYMVTEAQAKLQVIDAEPAASPDNIMGGRSLADISREAVEKEKGMHIKGRGVIKRKMAPPKSRKQR